MSDSGLQKVESVGLVVLVVAYALVFIVRRLRRARPDFHIALPLAIAVAIRLWAMASISSTGLESTLRGGDETTFLNLAHILAATPWGHGFWPHGPYQLQTVVFAVQLKALHSSVGAMRITQVGIAITGVILIAAAVHDLAGRRASRLAMWLLAFEPASIFFDSALYKEPMMELASGLVVFGATRIWLRLDVRGILICALGGLIAVETRSYAGWFLISAAVLVLLHASLRNLDRPMRAMPLIYAVVIALFIATPVLLQLSSRSSLQRLQVSQNANATGAGEGTGGSNSDNLALEQVNFSSRGAILQNLPKRIRDVILKPYPWQLADTSQRFGALGTLFAYAVLLLLLRYAWLSRGQVMARIAPLLYPLLFLLMAYSLSAGNAGTAFRYRSHLVTLVVAIMAILRETVLSRARSSATAQEPEEFDPRAARRPAASAV